MKRQIIYALTILTFISIGCDNNDNSNLATNRWIQEVMEEIYLWEEEIPDGLDPTAYSDPQDFFEKFIYEDDKWSWLSDDYDETVNLYSGVSTTSGLEYSLALLSDESSVIGIVDYSLKDSPADEAGIKRGDIFTRIDGTSLNINNYYSLLTQGGSYTITLGYIENNTIYESNTVNITEVENFQEDPIYVDTVFEVNGKKIGYLMYNTFLSSYTDEVDAVFANFKSQGVTDLIVDLRYNTGGSVAAEDSMANLIAPTSANNAIFQKEIWNDLYNSYYAQTYGSDYLNTRINISDNNINLSGQMIGITGPYTASASEGLLNGLDPLLNLTLIGDTTYGKYTAMTVIGDDKSNPEWAIIPIIYKTTNKDGVSVKDGMLPDILLSDNPLDGYQLGNINETMLAKAIEQITGVSSTKSIKIMPSIISNKLGHFRDGQRIKPMPQLDDVTIINVGM